MLDNKLLLYSDGGARGNPGPSAIAFLAVNEKGDVLAANTRFLGVRTNNQAEYEALLYALEYASNLKAKQVVCFLDSELVCKQLNGEYQVKNPQLLQLYRKVQILKKNFVVLSFLNVTRENVYIQKADKLVNQTLDKQKGLTIS
jgi:ribonuclease HI